MRGKLDGCSWYDMRVESVSSGPRVAAARAEAVLWPTRGVRHERQLRPAGRARRRRKARPRGDGAALRGGRGVRAADGLGHGVGGALCARRGCAAAADGRCDAGGLRLGVRRRGSAYARCGMSRRRGLPRGTAASARGRGHVRRLPRTRGGGAARRDGRGTSQRAEQYPRHRVLPRPARERDRCRDPAAHRRAARRRGVRRDRVRVGDPAAPAREAAGASHGLSAAGGGGGTAARDGAGPRAGDAGKLRARGAREAAYAARGGFSPL